MRNRPGLIGRTDEPVRAVTFAGGGFATSLQLGVTHALLVSRSEAPDVVVGISAGAVNAVALAEILQAGETEKDPERRLARRVERFRSVFESYQAAPSELRSALLPDSLQIDTQRPLEPLELPIHAERERNERTRSLHSRSGLVNVYNQLLALNLPVGTIARAVRRYLGLKAIGEERDFARLMPTFIGESLPFLDMIGANLLRLAPLAPVILPAALLRNRKPPEAASAGELIFQTRAWDALKRLGSNLLALATLVVLWLVLTAIALAVLPLTALLIPLAILLRLGRASASGLWLRAARGFETARSSFKILLRKAGFTQVGRAHSSTKQPRGSGRFRSALEWIGNLPGLRWSPQLVRNLRNTLSLSRALERLGGTRGFRWASEALRRIRKKRLLRIRTKAAPPPVIPDLAAMNTALRTWGRLYVTLLLRWVAWVIPVVALVLVPFGGRYKEIAGLAALALFLLGLCGIALFVVRRKDLLLNILRRNAIAEGLLDPHPIRQLLARLFDPDYYGELIMDRAVENAMADSPEAPRHSPQPNRLSRYSEGSPSIRVGVAAANVKTGEMETLAEEVPVVDALLAALAVVPVFPPQKIDDDYYVDGTNIANEPTRPMLKFLRQRIPDDERQPSPGDLNPNASLVHMYTVSPLPISKPELGVQTNTGDVASGRADGATTAGSHWPLVDVIERAFKLQRFRDASLERRLAELHTRAMPANGGLFYNAPPAYDGDIGTTYLRTWVYPIEPQKPISVNRRLMRARSEEARRRIIAETVADGCRAALEAMIQPDIRRAGRARVRCRKAIDIRLNGKTETAFPGNDTNYGPGLIEVCRHCALTRADDGSVTKKQRCRLVAKPEEQTPPSWPLENERSEGPHDKPLKLPQNPQKGNAIKALREWSAEISGPAPWPRPRQEPQLGNGPPSRPTVSLLFSGGVFRGVYQLGVLNALSEVGLRPDIVAGASVGSITAAMAARVFAEDRGRKHRGRRVRRLAATYMAIDRLVLTDRFSDFVRTMTVRAAQTRFSLRQADRVIRQYDRALPGSYERQARMVLAGLERLLYISPFEFMDLLKALRLRRPDTAFALIKEFFQELLDRGGVGDEVLGAEPLELLITEHVLKRPGLTATELRSTPFEHFLGDGIFLLATATNLTQGRLEVLGEQQLGAHRQPTSLIQGLLASSAFPGVFRPLRSSEVMPNSANEDLFTDGGVMDNLPLDAVARFLLVASEAGLIRARPHTPEGPVPHLLFSASLQDDPSRLSGRQVEQIVANWPRLRKRTKRLSYNQKLDVYERAQQAVRRIWGPSGHQTLGGFRPLDIEVVTVRPRWLCGTFAFHPMLGFRRLQQARSIAHGCASTLIRLDAYRRIPTRARWAGKENWGLNLDRLPDLDRDDNRSPFDPVTPPERAAEGYCWFRPDEPCPFSRHTQTSSASAELDGHTLFELDRIHTQCGIPETHAPGA